MMLYNTANKTWHPIFYQEAPMPGSEDDSKNGFIRLKSKGHHTSGFETKELAMADVPNLKQKMEEHLYLNVALKTDVDIEWDGSGVPADVTIESPSLWERK